MEINSALRQQPKGYALFILPALIGAAILILAAPVMYVLLFCPMGVCKPGKY